MAKRKLSKALACVNKATHKLVRKGKKVTKTERRKIGRKCQTVTPKRRGHGRTIRTMKQTGTRKSLHLDRQRKALPPGRRISRSGRRYTETRRNRSDRKGTNI